MPTENKGRGAVQERPRGLSANGLRANYMQRGAGSGVGREGSEEAGQSRGTSGL